MTVEDIEIIDLITKDEISLEIRMIISDHLEWGGGDDSHMYLLQEKINSYLRFYESGEIYEHYPEARESNVIIKVVGKHSLSSKAEWFYSQITPVIECANLGIEFELWREI